MNLYEFMPSVSKGLGVTDQEISLAMTRRGSLFNFNGVSTYPIQSVESASILSLLHCNETIRNIVRTSGQLFSVKKNDASEEIVSTELGKEFLGLLDTRADQLKNVYAGARLDPLVELFVIESCTRDLHSLRLIWLQSNSVKKIWIVDVFNGCISAIRKAANSDEFKAKRKFIQNSLSKRQLQLGKYCVDIYDQGQEFYISALEFCLTGNFNSQEKGNYNQALESFRKLCTYLETIIGSALIGFVWKCDFNSNHAQLFHLIIFSRKHLSIDAKPDMVDMLKRYWIERCCPKGCGFFLAFMGPGYPYPGLGLDRSVQAEIFFQNLFRSILIYNVSTDQFIAYSFADGSPSFGIGAPQVLNSI